MDISGKSQGDIIQDKIITLYIKNMAGDIFDIKYNKDNDIINIYKIIKNILKKYTIERIHLFHNSVELYEKDKSSLQNYDKIDMFISEQYKEKCVVIDYIKYNNKKCLRCGMDWYPKLWDSESSERRTPLTLFILKNKEDNEFIIKDNSYYYGQDKWFKNITDAFIDYKHNYNVRSYREKLSDNEISNLIHIWNINNKFDDYESNNDRLFYSRYSL